MRISILLITIWIVSFGLIVQSCSKEDTNIDLTSSSWKIDEVIWGGQSASEKADNLYVLEFVSDTRYTLGLDVNTCLGIYTMLGKGNIEIKGMGCTELCCDSEFAMKLSQLLPKMTQYYGIVDELHLEGDGKIILMKN